MKPRAPQPKTVVMVEDDERISTPFRTRLRKDDIKVIVRASGDEAVDFFLTNRESPHRVDLIVLDLALPSKKGGKIGRDTGSELLRITNYFHLIDAACPVIIYTGNASYDNCVACIKAGAYAYIPKTDDDGSSFQKLIELCRYLLLLEDRKTPRDLWLERNAERLRKKYAGKILGVFEEKAAVRAGRNEEIEDGYIVIPCVSVEALANLMIHDAKLRWEPFFYIDARQR